MLKSKVTGLKPPREQGCSSDFKKIFRENLKRLLAHRKITAATFVREVFPKDTKQTKYKWFLRLLSHGTSRVRSETEKDLKLVANRLGVKLADLWVEYLALNEWEQHKPALWLRAQRLVELVENGHDYLLDFIDGLYRAHKDAEKNVLEKLKREKPR